MEKPTTLQAALDALDAANSRIGNLLADIEASDNLLNQATSLQTALDSANAENASQKEMIGSLEQKICSLEEAVKLSEFKLNEAIAKAGVPPVSVLQAPVQEESKEDLWKQFRSLSVYDKPAFWSKHKAALTR